MTFRVTPSPRQLLSRFFLTTIGGLIVVAALTLAVSDHLIESFAREDGEKQNKVLTRAVSNALDAELLRWLAVADVTDPAAARLDPTFIALDRGIQEMKDALPILKVELYRLDGTAIYSTGPEALGETADSSNRAFWQAAQGTPYSQVERQEDFAGPDGTLFFRDAVASYLPLLIDGETVGVFEIYTDYNHIVGLANRYFPRVAGLVLIACLILYGIVALFVWQAQRDLSVARDRLVDAREQAEAANHAKSRFLANMSHELRTPLNAILGFAEIMQKERFGSVGDTRYKSYADDIYTSGVHLRSLIDDVLDMSKVEAGSVEIDATKFDMRDLLDDVVRIMRARIEGAGQIFDYQEPETPMVLETDPRLVRQILLNLLSNATKFTPTGGTVRLHAAQDTDHIRIAVEDTGIGMSPAEIDEALTPFGQPRRGRERGAGGTGLGLPICRSLTELLGGDFDIRSVPDEGTAVRCALPRPGPRVVSPADGKTGGLSHARRA